MEKLIHEDISFKIIGIAYSIDNQIGYGQTEKVYADAFETLLTEERIDYKREFYSPIKINEKVIAKRYFDFLIEDKVIVELKINDRNYRDACSQIFQYLKQSKLKLGLIIRFTKFGVKIKRIPNIR